jgi:hypothetical protein
MEGAAKPSTSSGSGVTDGASGRSGTATADASMEEWFADLCKVRALTCRGVRLLVSGGLGFFFCLRLGVGICFPLLSKARFLSPDDNVLATCFGFPR